MLGKRRASAKALRQDKPEIFEEQRGSRYGNNGVRRGTMRQLEQVRACRPRECGIYFECVEKSLEGFNKRRT